MLTCCIIVVHIYSLICPTCACACMPTYWMCVSALACVCLCVCVSGAWAVTHSDCEPRPPGRETCVPGRSQQGSKAAQQLSSAPLVVAGPSPCHSEEVFTRTPYWEASSVKTGQCHHVLLLATMLAPQQGRGQRAERKHGHLCQLICTVFAIFP